MNFSNPVGWSASGGLGGPRKLPEFTHSTEWTFYPVPAIPLYTLLAALGWKEVDFFSFDIEGKELSVLKTFPFERVVFKVLIVEVSQMYVTPGIEREMDGLLKKNGYVFVRDMQIDKIYVHGKYKNMIRK